MIKFVVGPSSVLCNSENVTTCAFINYTKLGDVQSSKDKKKREKLWQCWDWRECLSLVNMEVRGHIALELVKPRFHFASGFSVI